MYVYVYVYVNVYVYVCVYICTHTFTHTHTQTHKHTHNHIFMYILIYIHEALLHIAIPELYKHLSAGTHDYLLCVFVCVGVRVCIIVIKIINITHWRWSP